MSMCCIREQISLHQDIINIFKLVIFVYQVMIMFYFIIYGKIFCGQVSVYELGGVSGGIAILF